MKTVMKKAEGLQKEYLIAENKAHDTLLKAGYRPQGYDFKTHKIVVFKIINEHRNNEKTIIYYFEDYQTAVKFLIK